MWNTYYRIEMTEMFFSYTQVIWNKIHDFLLNELQYRFRFFSVYINENGKIEQLK